MASLLDSFPPGGASLLGVFLSSSGFGAIDAGGGVQRLAVAGDGRGAKGHIQRKSENQMIRKASGDSCIGDSWNGTKHCNKFTPITPTVTNPKRSRRGAERDLARAALSLAGWP